MNNLGGREEKRPKKLVREMVEVGGGIELALVPAFSRCSLNHFGNHLRGGLGP